LRDLLADAPETRAPFGVCGAIFDHWLALRDSSARDDSIPTREQIDMLSLPVETIPWFFINQRAGDRYVNRLAGTAMVSGVGFETKGRFLDEMMAPEVYPERKALFDICAGHGVCVHYRATLAVRDRNHVGFSRILFPAASAATGPVDLVCGTMVFFGDASLHPKERAAIADGSSGILFKSYYDGGTWRRLDDSALQP